MENILKRIEEIARIIFDDDLLSISESTNSDDIEDWDSLTQIQLLDNLEKEFSIKFSLDEMMNNSTMGEMANTIKSKMT